VDEWIGRRQGEVLRLPRSLWRGGATPATVLVRRLEVGIARVDALPFSMRQAQLLVEDRSGLAWRVDQILSRYLVRTRAQAVPAFQRRLAAEGNGYSAASRREGER
jgi:hypothetical protein